MAMRLWIFPIPSLYNINMKVSGSLPELEDSIFDIAILVDTPLSGFEFSLMETGAGASPHNLMQFSGKEGYLFDQSGNFFGGYQSGVPFSMSVHYDWTHTGFKYYFDGVLVANDLKTSVGALPRRVNQLQFEKHGNSTINVFASGNQA